jgi:hypothetical protein
MSARTVRLDEEAYEILSRKRQEEQGKISTARDLLEYVKHMKISEEALDRMEEVVQSRRRSPARIVDL